MHTIRRARLLTLAALGLSAGLSTGCQTWFGGMTLPSPHYLEGHPPQYFPEEPQFPLTRELSYQEEAAGLHTDKKKGSGSHKPGKEKVGQVKRKQLEDIARLKMPDMTAGSLEAAMNTIAGTARSMGIDIVD